MTDEVKMLSDDEVAEIEARPYITVGWGRRIELKPEERDALCATVRALRVDYALVENYLVEIKRELGLPPNAVLGVTLENYKERVTAPLREQLAQSQAGYQRATIGLSNLYHVITNENCDDAVALGMATSAVGSLIRQRDELQSQLAQVTQERDELRQEIEFLQKEA